MRRQNLLIVAIQLLLVILSLVNAQVPPRLSIPGAIPIGIPNHAPTRSAGRVRRPVALRQQQQSNLVAASLPSRHHEEKPVTESGEDEVPDVYLPQLLREQQLAQAQQAQFQQTAAAFLNGGGSSVEPNTINESPISHLLNNEENLPTNNPYSTRFPERTLTSPQPSPTPTRPVFNDFGIGSSIINSPRFSQDRQPPAQPQAAPQIQIAPVQQRERVNVVRSRPNAIHRENIPARQQQYDAPQAPAPRPRPKPVQPRPVIDQNQLQDDNHHSRRQKPVAQTIRKWREENEDGSITWGYENDDGSFKEELIGTDCVTKGTYGYIDPDGNKREYNYETGIKCDPNRRNEEEDELQQQNGFINYEENRAVLPNGIEIDMSQLGKKKSKRPGVNYRN